MRDWLKRASGPISNAGIFKLYRQRARVLRRGQTPCPPARPAWRLVSATAFRHPTQRDGKVEMSETDAAPLLQAGWVRVDVGDPAATGSGR
jgi:hypothetical protein